jgi:hypothetical protein
MHHSMLATGLRRARRVTGETRRRRRRGRTDAPLLWTRDRARASSTFVWNQYNAALRVTRGTEGTNARRYVPRPHASERCGTSHRNDASVSRLLSRPRSRARTRPRITAWWAWSSLGRAASNSCEAPIGSVRLRRQRRKTPRSRSPCSGEPISARSAADRRAERRSAGLGARSANG